MGTGLAGAVLIFATACSGGGNENGGGGSTTVGGKDEPDAPQVTITPGNGAGKAKPESGVQVKVANGSIEQVQVTRKGKPVEGRMSADKTSWKSRTLRPSSEYEVSVVAKNTHGKTTAATSKFATLKPAAELTIADITPSSGEKVGVGMPIIVTFNRAVSDRKAVESALTVKSTKPAVGAWYWVSNSQVIFRTKNGAYWKPNQTVRVSAKLAGVRSGKNTYGVSDVSRGFRIGNEHITTVSTKTKKATFKVNGKVVKRTGVSAGKGGRVRNGVDTYLTTSGVHLTMSKHLVERMTSAWMGVTDKKDPEYYDLKLPHAVRISNSGEYLHASPDRYWAFGRTNASHGCVNLPPPVAKFFYDLSYRGDPVVITGSKRGLDPFNGWSFYEMSWSRWVKGSALDRTVTTG
ncbi:Ig-like domain-containing protein [Spirillospora sp. NPDC047279]|uniref:L,D-transpeptidase n=1 Tax=Spirillospora sp. NPDC047279 TaxID=3155478 RepID=UPI0033DC0A7E